MRIFLRALYFFLVMVILSGCLALCQEAEIPDRFRYSLERRPVHWLTEDKLVLLGEQDVFIRTFEPHILDRPVFSIPAPLRRSVSFEPFGCFSDNSWVLSSLSNGLHSNRGGLISYEVRLNDGAVTSQLGRQRSSAGRINRHDCSTVSYPSSPNLPSRRATGAVSETVANTLFSLKDAENVSAYMGKDGLVIQYRQDDLPHQLVLQGYDGKRLSRLNAIKDNGRPNYLIVDREFRGVSGYPRSWPLRAWIVDLHQHDARHIDLPRGPWVAKHEEKLQCFSCGCGCYQNMELYLVDEKVYAQISGIGFPRSVRGLYSFNFREWDAGWKGIVTGIDLENAAFSKSGCRVAVKSHHLEVLSLC